MKWFGSTFTILSFSTLCLFIVLGLGGLLQSKFVSPVSSMKGLTASVSSQFFYDMLALEVPRLHKNVGGSTFSQNQMVDFVIQFVTDIRPGDPKSLLAREMPGLSNRLEQWELPNQQVNHPQDQVADLSQEQLEELVEQVTQPPSDSEDVKPVNNGLTGNQKKVFIYHSHNRESWVPELKDKGASALNDAFDSEINVTLLGTRLAERLQDLGIGAISSNKDYPTEVEGYNWNFAYKYSLETVKEAFAVHPEIEYYFDIHRDAQKKDLTTATIDGKSYAQVYFIIGHKNPNWQQNEALAKRIHDRMEQEYPGISRGVWGKKANNGHAEYNQSFSENSILIEIGGPENTLEESYRTVDILASVIADIIWEAQKVDVPVTPPPKAS